VVAPAHLGHAGARRHRRGGRLPTGAVDLPAGALIATEAGAVLTALDGKPYRLSVERTEHSFIAARPERVGALVAMLAEASALELPPLG